MPRFIIQEERHDLYSATIEADNLQHALELYEQDSEEVFGNKWEQDDGNGCELRSISELDEDGVTVVKETLFENGEQLEDDYFVLTDPRLPVVKLYYDAEAGEFDDEKTGLEKLYYADVRLKEYRAVDNPHDVVKASQLPVSMEEIIEKYRKNGEGGVSEWQNNCER